MTIWVTPLFGIVGFDSKPIAAYSFLPESEGSKAAELIDAYALPVVGQESAAEPVPDSAETKEDGAKPNDEEPAKPSDQEAAKASEDGAEPSPTSAASVEDAELLEKNLQSHIATSRKEEGFGSTVLIYGGVEGSSAGGVDSLLVTARTLYPRSKMLLVEDVSRPAAELAKLKAQSVAQPTTSDLILSVASLGGNSIGHVIGLAAGAKCHPTSDGSIARIVGALRGHAPLDIAKLLYTRRTGYVDTASQKSLTFLEAAKWGTESQASATDTAAAVEVPPSFENFDWDAAQFDEQDGPALAAIGVSTCKSFENIVYRRDGKPQPIRIFVESQLLSDQLTRALRSILRNPKWEVEFFRNESALDVQRLRAFVDAGTAIYEAEITDFFAVDPLTTDLSELKLFTFQEGSEAIRHIKLEIDVAYQLYHNNRRGAFLRKLEEPDFQLNLDDAILALKGGVYSPFMLEEGFEYVIRSMQTFKEPDLRLFLEKAWRTLGASILSKRVFDSADRRRKELTHPTVMLMAAFYCDIGDYPKAIALAGDAIKKEKNAWKWARYVGLTNLLYREGLVSDRWAEIDVETYDYFTASNGAFLNLIAQSNGSYCVVGNSPVIRGTAAAAHIDSHDVVVRFNTAERSYPFSLDTGTKLDVLIMNPDYSQTRRVLDPDIRLIVFSNGDLYSSKNLSQKIHDLRGRYAVELLPRYIDLATLRKVEGSPSSGLKTLQWIYSKFGPIPSRQVHGFSLDDQIFGHATSYTMDGPRRMPVIHNWNAEASAFKEMIDYSDAEQILDFSAQKGRANYG